jgi:hypothetical protein
MLHTGRFHHGLPLVLSFTLALSSLAQPDLIVFDEDDPIGTGFYDASFGFATAPSTITAGGTGADKLIIVTESAHTGEHSGLIEWTSRAGGTWTFFVASPGWQTRDASAYSNIVMQVNGPAAIPAEALPSIGLESSTNIRTPTVPMGDYLSEGLDDDAGTWQQVTIPLEDFQPYGGFQLAQFKDVNFSQGIADDTPHTLWFDAVRLTTGDGGTHGPPPGAPAQVVTRSGDLSIVLHWDRNPEADLAGYHVYRGTLPLGPFTNVTTSPVASPSFADLTPINGTTYFYQVTAINSTQQESEPSLTVSAAASPFADNDAFLDYVQQTAFDFFWYEANPTNGLVRDRSQPFSTASVAATGFGLTAICIAIDHGWISRETGRDRVLTTLQTFWEGPQGTNTTGQIGYRGWFYHFLEINSATRAGSSELSSIDTALVLAGMLHAKQYFDQSHPDEDAIRSLADSIFDRVDWLWMTDGGDSLTMGWMPESGFLGARWIGYNEAMILYLLGMGAESDPLPPEHWTAWTSDYNWTNHYGFDFVEFPPLFGHQYSHAWVDFRHIADPYMLDHGSTYFENSRRATLAQHAYALENPGQFAGYGDRVWGLTACDGPGTAGYFSYRARGTPPPENDDGTVAPTAVGGSLPFAPEQCLPTLRYFYDQFRTNIWTGYGFRDAFNLDANWWGPDILGIDQGPIVIMAENYRSQSVWHVFMREPIVQRGLASAGFVTLPSVAASIEPAPDLTAMTLTWPATPGQSYQVEYSPDLFRWFISNSGLVEADGPSATWTDSGPPATDRSPTELPQKYYRVTNFELRVSSEDGAE